jgi:hypothetical protein
MAAASSASAPPPADDWADDALRPFDGLADLD